MTKLPCSLPECFHILTSLAAGIIGRMRKRCQTKPNKNPTKTPRKKKPNFLFFDYSFIQFIFLPFEKLNQIIGFSCLDCNLTN